VQKAGLLCLVFVVGLSFAGASGLAQDLVIEVHTDSSEYTIGQDTLILSVLGFNVGPAVNVDVHIALITPDWQILEWPDWNTQFRPVLSDVVLPNGFDYPLSELGSYLVGGPEIPIAAPGQYVFAAAYTVPGTLEFMADVSFALFEVKQQGQAGGTYGHAYLDWMNSYDSYLQTWQIWVDAGAFFYQESSRAALGAWKGEEGCQVKTYDWGSYVHTYERWLDAGEKIDMFGSPLGDVELVKNEQMGIIQYMAWGGLTEGHYGPGSTYTFVGYGGPDVGPFSASVVAPPIVELAEPALDQIPVVDRSQDLAVRWTGTGSGYIYVVLTSYTINEQTMEPTSVTSCSCVFEDDGEATIPSGALSQLPVPPASTYYRPYFVIMRCNEVEFGADGLSGGGSIGAYASVDGNVELK